MHIEARLVELGVMLPAPLEPPVGVRAPFAPMCIYAVRAHLSVHGPTQPDGSLRPPSARPERRLLLSALLSART